MRLLVFDTHPVQYRVPIWQEMERRAPGSIHVVYASNCSVRGHWDEGFGQTVAWDEPMLSGYRNTILNCESGTLLAGWGSLTGRGIAHTYRRVSPTAVLLTGFNYRYDSVAFVGALRRRIPTWLRCETQDHAVSRSSAKAVIRSSVYRVAYRCLDRVFYIGELNRQHYRYHGVHPDRLCPARYGTVDRYVGMKLETKLHLRRATRKRSAIGDKDLVIGFSGKLIEKKNPSLLFDMVSWLPYELRKRVVLYFVGAGQLEGELRSRAHDTFARLGARTSFVGFVNQSQIGEHYLAMDALVLPSRRMGETWGLVANEAMQAGCCVVVSTAVGCAADFGSWERFRIFCENDPCDLAKNVYELAGYNRQFDWARESLRDYEIEATAATLLQELKHPRFRENAHRSFQTS